MKTYVEQTFDEERALYGVDGVEVVRCRFEGPADGESAMKEGRNIKVRESAFLLRYPFWHDTHLSIRDSEMTETCRAALGSRAGSVKVFDDRLPCGEYLKTAVQRGDVVIIAGARDESLSIWAKSMTKYA